MDIYTQQDLEEGRRFRREQAAEAKRQAAEDRRIQQEQEKAEYEAYLADRPWKEDGTPFGQKESELAQKAVDITNSKGIEDPDEWNKAYKETLVKMAVSTPNIDFNYEDLPKVSVDDNGVGELETAARPDLLDNPTKEQLDSKYSKANEVALTLKKVDEVLTESGASEEERRGMLWDEAKKANPKLGLDETPEYIQNIIDNYQKQGADLGAAVNMEETPQEKTISNLETRADIQKINQGYEKYLSGLTSDQTDAEPQETIQPPSNDERFAKAKEAIDNLISGTSELKKGVEDYGSKVEGMGEMPSIPENEGVDVENMRKVQEIESLDHLRKLKDQLSNMSVDEILQYAESHIPQETQDKYAQQQEAGVEKQSEDWWKQQQEAADVNPEKDTPSMLEGGDRTPTKAEYAAEIGQRNLYTQEHGSPYVSAYAEDGEYSDV
jgi:hypothetical protein